MSIQSKTGKNYNNLLFFFIFKITIRDLENSFERDFMAVAFQRGSTTGPNDLQIVVRDYKTGNYIDPYLIQYSVFDFTTGIEVLQGSPVNTPLRISKGVYYASVNIPADGNIGMWRIHWTLQEYASDPVYQSVQEFQVVGDSTISSFTGDTNIDKLIYSLRVMLRDQNPDRNYSVSGEEKVRVKCGGKNYILSIEELWKVIHNLRNKDYLEQYPLIKRTTLEIYEGFKKQKLEVLSVSQDKKVEWKRILDATRHDVSNKPQYKITTDQNQVCHATGDHSLYTIIEDKLTEWKTGDFEIGSDIVCIENGKIVLRKIIDNVLMQSTKYMYDLSVEDNHNFRLESGILAHNTFRPPESSKFIQGQTQVFGFIWEDEELLECLEMAISDFNGRPPTTSITLGNIIQGGTEQRWRTTILVGAAVWACFGVAMTWIANEFSLHRDERITVQDKNGNEYNLTVEELFDIMYGERLKEITEQAKKQVLESIQEIENENL
jgi:hypothetical protein